MSLYITKKNFIAAVVTCITFVIVYVLTVGAQNVAAHDFFVYFTFGLNGVLWLVFLLNELNKHAFSLVLVHWLFCIFFFFFAGIIQTLNNDYPWVDPYSDATLVATNLILLLWSILFRFGVYKAATIQLTIGKKNIEKTLKKQFEERNFTGWTGYKSKVNILMIIAVFITVYRVVNIGFINLLARGTSSFSVSENSSISVFVEKTAMALVYFAFIYAVFKWEDEKKPLPIIVTGFCLLLSYFPTSTARNAIAGLYFGALLAMFPKMKKNKWFISLYLLIFMIAFPMLNAFRTVSILDVNLGQVVVNVLENFSSGWLAVDYDAYSMVALSLTFLKDHGITMGMQLVGVILFFVPRSIWPTKPIGTGTMIAEYYGWWFTNVSEPLPAEMLVNFGIVGMAVCAILIGFLLGKIDLYFWRNISDNPRMIHRFDALYYYMVGYFLFLYRGSLLSCFAYLVPLVLVWLVLTWNHREISESDR
ncbi:O-antigen polysaccharide polymerase Wzy [Kineothrix sp. MSJ-39]|uniref:O-antigen polysaccharide polymerase Wzy n=1 Tax=Kineothrix sp. MSJ-39 TaxID=2841533 RepID=UPI001C1173C2|nr:O-antigen polysaccharide polymerase Wzy [Kineothrix sp. MSJ-39]MBU5430649.1 O-antigen polysaccharide polymerase Wzy [Kineothrix sp. MSJ-39]